MNQFSVFEALDLSGLLVIVILGISMSIILIASSIIVANSSWSCGWTKSIVFWFIIGIASLILIPFFFGWVSYTTINTEYNKIMSVDEKREYTAVEIYKEFGVEMPDGTYRIDLSEMDKELFSRIKRDEKNPYNFIIEKASD